MATLDEAAQQLQVSKATLRRWIKSGSIEAYLDKNGPHGPQWHIPDGVLSRRLHPDQSVITVLPPEDPHPMQMITVIKDTLITVESTVARIAQSQEQMAQTMVGMHDELLFEMRQLKQQMDRGDTRPPSRWWPWARRARRER